MRLNPCSKSPSCSSAHRILLISILPAHQQPQRFYSASASSTSTSSSGPPTPPPRSISFLPASSSTPLSPTPQPEAVPAPDPPGAALDQATELFIRPRPRFLYSAPRFLHLPRNTRVPEVCILGRSNVGKSTLLNALSGVETHGRAGRSHGSARGRAGIAITSAKAGCTKTLNGYGFGPPMVLPRHEEGSEAAAEQEEGEEEDAAAAGRRATRSQRREAVQRREPPPKHSLVVMDMPGYGLHSREEWGAEIAKYLARRAMLRGAVVLVDAVAGVKDGDRLALGLLRDAGVRTAVVLTKADKLVGDGAALLLRKRCVQVWEELRRVESKGRRSGWGGGRRGWEPEIFVTGAGDPTGGGLGVAGARLALCRLAGLVEGEVEEVVRADKGLGLGSGKVVPFDQIQWAAGQSNEVPRAELGMPAEQAAAMERTPRRGRVKPWKRQGGDALDVLAREMPRKKNLGRASF